MLMSQLKGSQAGEILSSLGACMCAKSFHLHPTVCDSMDYSQPGSSLHGDSPGKTTRVGCHALLQGIFPTQGSTQVRGASDKESACQCRRRKRCSFDPWVGKIP